MLIRHDLDSKIHFCCFQKNPKKRHRNIIVQKKIIVHKIPQKHLTKLIPLPKPLPLESPRPMDDAVRKAKEAFVTGHNGGDIMDITYLVINSGLSSIITQFLLTYKLNKPISQSFDFFFTFIFPLLSCLFTQFSIIITVIQLWIIFYIYINYPFYSFTLPPTAWERLDSIINSGKKSDQNSSQDLSPKNTPSTNPLLSPYIELASQPSNDWDNNTLRYHIPAISYLRSGLFILTAICILAVDFVIFPRSNAKTEEYGTGLMDIGVGGFLFSNALVHPLTRIPKKPNFDTQKSNLFQLFHQIVVKPMYSALILFAVGFARCVGQSGINYQSHVSEYGVHWNFFFTLAAVMIFCSFLHYFMVILTPNHHDKYKNQTNEPFEVDIIRNSIIFIIFTTFVGTLLLILYHNFLSSPIPSIPGSIPMTYRQWIFGPDRGTLLAQNKEGVFSLFGYLPLAVISMGLGRCLNLMQFLWIRYYKQHINSIRDGYDKNEQNNKSGPKNQLLNAKNVLIEANQPSNILTSLPDPTPSNIEDEFTLQYFVKVNIAKFQALFLLGISFFLFFLTQFFEKNVEKISRRLCNISFCFWILHIATLLLGLCSIPNMIYYLRFNPTLGLGERSDQNNSKKSIKNGQDSPSTSSIIPQDLNNRHTNPWGFNIDMILSLQHHYYEELLKKQIEEAKTHQKNVMNSYFNRNNNKQLVKMMDLYNPTATSSQSDIIHEDENKHSPQALSTTRISRQNIRFNTHADSNHIPDLFNPVLPLQNRFIRPKHRQTTVLNHDIYVSAQSRLSIRPNYTHRGGNSRTRADIGGIQEGDENGGDDGDYNNDDGKKMSKSGLQNSKKAHNSRKIDEEQENNAIDGCGGNGNMDLIEMKPLVSNSNLISVPSDPFQASETTKIDNNTVINYDGYNTIVEGVNRNALKYFLVTNLCTGFTNMAIVTMNQPDHIAFIILCIYLLVSYLITTRVNIGVIFKTIFGCFFGRTKN
jgi:hypothetical protein